MSLVGLFDSSSLISNVMRTTATTAGVVEKKSNEAGYCLPCNGGKFSLYLKHPPPPILPPPGLNIEEIMEQVTIKRNTYFSDPSTTLPLKYTADEEKVLRYICETSPFFSMTHIGIHKYEISMDGRLRTIDGGYITRGSVNGAGRRVFTLREVLHQQIQVQVNVLVGKAFLGPPPTPKHTTIDHMDIDETNDYLYNLRWATMNQQNLNKKPSNKLRRGRPVTQINPKTGEEMFTWFRCKDAAKFYGLESATGIYSSIRDFRLAAGFRWRYAMNLLVDGNGILEEFRSVVFEGREIWVSSFGRVSNSKFGLWYGHKDGKGRRHVAFRLTNNNYLYYSVHRLVMLAFVGSSDLHVNHIDGIPSHNWLSNLEYVTCAENNQHAVDNNLRKDQFNNNRSKPVVQLDAKTKKFVKEFPSVHEASRSTGYRLSNIAGVLAGRRNTAFGFIWIFSDEYFDA